MLLTHHDKQMLQKLTKFKKHSFEHQAMQAVFNLAVCGLGHDHWKTLFAARFSKDLDTELLNWILDSYEVFNTLGEMFYKRFYDVQGCKPLTIEGRDNV